MGFEFKNALITLIFGHNADQTIPYQKWIESKDIGWHLGPFSGPQRLKTNLKKTHMWFPVPPQPVLLKQAPRTCGGIAQWFHSRLTPRRPAFASLSGHGHGIGIQLSTEWMHGKIPLNKCNRHEETWKKCRKMSLYLVRIIWTMNSLKSLFPKISHEFWSSNRSPAWNRLN